MNGEDNDIYIIIGVIVVSLIFLVIIGISIYKLFPDIGSKIGLGAAQSL